MHPQIEKLIIDLADEGIPPEVTLAAAIEAWEEGVPIGAIPKVVRSLVDQALGKHKHKPRSEREESRESVRREAEAEAAKQRRASRETEAEKHKKRVTNPRRRRK